MDQQLHRVSKAYDLTVDQYRSGIDPLAQVPETFKNSSEFKMLTDRSQSCSSGAPENRAYLDPKPGMRFLDVGCCANLHNHRLDQWPATYYGVDISLALIEAMERFVAHRQISIGGLHVAEITNLPFDDNFFDIADVIGVLEYCTLEYIQSALLELNRVLRSRAKVVLDIPNLEHPLVQTMFQLEQYLGRPNVPHPRDAFEEILKPLFSIERADDSHVMLKYFVRALKPEGENP